MAVDPLQQIRIAGLLQSSFRGTASPEEESRSGPALRPGTAVSAKVVAQLLDGRVVLDVDGAPFQTRLPPGVPAGLGTRLPLVVIEGGETPTFGLDPGSADGTPTSASARVALSGLSSQLQAIAAASRRDATAATATVQPLLPGPPESGGALEAPLRAALERSGLFYESHQAEWVAGHRELATLRQEPQARLARADPAGTAGMDEASTLPGARGPESAGRSGETGAQSAQVAPGAEPEPPASSMHSLPPGVATLVERQLQSLGTQQIQWSGPVWPGQTMEWEVREEERDAGDPSAQPVWTSRLRLELSRLGVVEAVLRLRGTTLAVDLRVAEDVQRDVHAEARILRDSLLARGLSLEALALRTSEDG